MTTENHYYKRLSPTPFMLQVKAKGEGDINLGAVGIAGNIGFQTLKGTPKHGPGFELKVGAALDALVGLQGKGTLDYSINTNRATNLYNNYVAPTVNSYYSEAQHSLTYYENQLKKFYNNM